MKVYLQYLRYLQLRAHILLPVIIFTMLPYILNTHTGSIKQSNFDLNGELDKKLDELFSYYKGMIKNTNADDKEKSAIIQTFDLKASQLISKSNSNDALNKTYKKEQEISFIQSSLKLNSNSAFEIFSYQPFVWTEFKVNKKGPASRRGHSAVLADTYVVIFGGCYMESNCYNDLFFMDLRTQNWVQVPTSGATPSPRQGHSAVLYGSTMWVYGGSSSQGYLYDLFSLNLETREWKKHYFASSKTTGLAGHGAVLDDNAKMIIFGGYTDSGYTNDIFTINLLDERFETPLTTGKPPSPRENFSMIKINGRIFVFGGFQEGGVLNDMYSIDLLTLTWTLVTTQGPTPPPRQGTASARVGKKLYLTGGCDYRQKLCYTDTYILDTDSLWWTKVENKGDFTITFFRGSLYTFGGCEMYQQCFNNVFIMNINDLCPNQCSTRGDCRAEIGCVCGSGYTSHDCAEKVKCKDDCSANGVCHNNAQCGCHPGWSGVVCNSIVPCPKNCTDVANGVCQPDTRCKCNPGFTGKDCAMYTIVGNDTNRSNDDPFKMLTAIGAAKIATKVTKKCLNSCSGHGACDASTGNCECEANFLGKDCSVNSRNSRNSRNVTAMSRKGRQDEDTGSADEQDEGPTTKTKAEVKSYSTSENSTSDKNSTDTSDSSGRDFSKAYHTESSKNYYQTKDCDKNCTKRGICLNSTCFCDQGFTNEDCSLSYKEYLNRGIKFSDVSMFIVIAFAAAFLITSIALACKKSHKASSDHLEFEEN